MATILKHWREAATLIIAARSKHITNKTNYEILMLKRSGKSKFMPSLNVFPGGVAEESDFSPEWLDVFSSLGSETCPKTFAYFAKGGPGAPMFSRKRDEQFSKIPSDVAFRICAIRETFEECGILLTRSPNDNVIDCFTDSRNSSVMLGKVANLSVTEVETWREKVDKDASQFLIMCKKFNVVPDIWSLSEWSNWLTPLNTARKTSGTDEGSKRRYDTAFFLCLLDNIPDTIHDDKEAVHFQWSSPDELIRCHLKSEIRLAPPQIYEICRFLNLRSFDELSNFSKERTHKRVERNFPVAAVCDDGIFILYHGDDLYPKKPDLYGESSGPLILEGTLQELIKRSKNHNRYIMTDKNSHRDFIKGVTFLCNVSVDDGHIIPKTDLSFMGLPSAKF